MRISYYIDFSDFLEPNEETATIVKKAIKAGLEFLEEKNDVEINISFITDKEMKALNKKYRNVDRTTDVLSFPLFETYPGLPSQLGDIVINEAQLKRQAKEYDHSYNRELVYLTIHSLLHLYGYDHIKQNEKAEMRHLEEEIYNYYLQKEEKDHEKG